MHYERRSDAEGEDQCHGGPGWWGQKTDHERKKERKILLHVGELANCKHSTFTILSHVASQAAGNAHLKMMQKPRLLCNFRCLSYPSTKFLTGTHGKTVYSHLNNSKMVELILIKLSKRIPCGAETKAGKFQPKRNLFKKVMSNWKDGGLEWK